MRRRQTGLFAVPTRYANRENKPVMKHDKQIDCILFVKIYKSAVYPAEVDNAQLDVHYFMQRSWL